MTLSRRRFITISAGMALSAAVMPAWAEPVTWRGTALGAEAKLVLTGLPEGAAARLIALARAEIERLENIFSLYRTDSAISELNRLGTLKAPAPELLALFSIVGLVHNATGGLFDPTVQPLWQAYARHNGMPGDAVIREAQRSVGWNNVEHDSSAIVFQKLDMRLTLNGIAQGFVTDRVTSLLRSEGLQNAVVNIGEISALGQGPDGDAWRVGLATHGDGHAEDFVRLSDQAVATSAPLGTTFNGDVSHIINPATGRPVPSNWDRVSVIHKSAALADGFSTAAVMMSEAEMRDGLKAITDAALIAKRRNGDSLTLKSWGPALQSGPADRI